MNCCSQRASALVRPRLARSTQCRTVCTLAKTMGGTEITRYSVTSCRQGPGWRAGVVGWAGTLFPGQAWPPSRQRIPLAGTAPRLTMFSTKVPNPGSHSFSSTLLLVWSPYMLAPKKPASR